MFNIYDMQKELSSCKVCATGAACEMHGLSRDANRRVMKSVKEATYKKQAYIRAEKER